MESPLITHIFIEAYFNHKGLLIEEQLLRSTERRKLFESYGIFNGCEEAAYSILSDVLDCKENQSQIVVSPKTLRFFVKKVVINLTLTQGNGGYDPDITVVNKDGTFDRIYIYLNRHKDQDTILTTLMHELTHAYQDYCLHKKSNSLAQQSQQSGYKKTTDYLSNPNIKGILKHMSKLLYILNNFEMGAFMTSLFIDTKKILKSNHFDNITQALNFIKKHSKIIPLYNSIKRTTAIYTDSSLTDDKKALILMAANRVTNNNFRNYKQLANYLKHKTQQMSNKIEKNLPKIVNDNLQVNHFMPPYGIEDIDLEIDEDKLFEWKNDY